MDHSFEEIRAAAIDVLARREPVSSPPEQYGPLMNAIAEVFERREGASPSAGYQRTPTFAHRLSAHDRDLFLEVFWSLFREGIITLGVDDANREFPFFRVTEFGRRIASHQQAYFFHDVSSYEGQIRQQVPEIDDTTVIYLKEAMQSFRVGCILAATVMLGVATEHTFFLLLDKIAGNAKYSATFAKAKEERTVLQKVNKFKNILDQQVKSLPPELKEDLDTHFTGILSIIRTFRNQSGHPTGRIIDREQAYVLLNLFIPYCKKMYQLMGHYG